MATTTAQSGGNGGFFSSITDSFQKGIQTIGSDVLPIWAAKELGVQTKNQLNKDTIDRSKQAEKLGDTTTEQTTNIIKRYPVATLLIVAAGVGLTVLIVKASK